jgi:hypothetical protein
MCIYLLAPPTISKGDRDGLFGVILSDNKTIQF